MNGLQPIHTIALQGNRKRKHMSVTLGNKFCSACGNELLSTAVICPKCGSPTSLYSPSTSQPGKSKTTAVVLAVFLGIWSWLYTYKKNAHKFWITFPILAVLFVTLLGFAVLASSYPSDAERAIRLTVATAWQFLVLGFWLWAILDNATKPQRFYRNYGMRS